MKAPQSKNSSNRPSLNIKAANPQQQQRLDDSINVFLNLLHQIISKNVSATLKNTKYYSFIQFLITTVYQKLTNSFDARQHNNKNFEEADIDELIQLNVKLNTFVNYQNPPTEESLEALTILLEKEITNWYNMKFVQPKQSTQDVGNKVKRAIWHSDVIKEFDKLQNNTITTKSNYAGELTQSDEAPKTQNSTEHTNSTSTTTFNEDLAEEADPAIGEPLNPLMQLPPEQLRQMQEMTKAFEAQSTRQQQTTRKKSTEQPTPAANTTFVTSHSPNPSLTITGTTTDLGHFERLCSELVESGKQMIAKTKQTTPPLSASPQSQNPTFKQQSKRKTASANDLVKAQWGCVIAEINKYNEIKGKFRKICDKSKNEFIQKRGKSSTIRLITNLISSNFSDFASDKKFDLNSQKDAPATYLQLANLKDKLVRIKEERNHGIINFFTARKTSATGQTLTNLSKAVEELCKNTAPAL